MASVKTYPGPDGGKQLLSREARAKRNKDNIAKASEQYRIDRRGENHKLGQRPDSDIHHRSDGSTERVSIKNNRGNFGNGTKKE